MKKINSTVIFILFNILFVYSQNKSKDTYKNKGLFNITRITISNVYKVKSEITDPVLGNVKFDVPSSNANAFGLTVINGFFLNPNFSLGFGFGLENFNNPGGNTAPIFLDARAYLKDAFNTPYIYTNYGSLLNLGIEFNKGTLFQIGAGYKYFPIKKKRLAFVTDLGYSYRKISLDSKAVNKSDNLMRFNAIALSLGILF